MKISLQSDERKIKFVTQGIAVFWIMMKVLSLKLWMTERNYPVVPFINMPPLIHLVLLSIFFILAGWLIYKPENKKIITTLIFIELINILGDQNRLQPWHYQYIFTFIAIAANFKNKSKALQAIVLITVATYFFSGLQKLNRGFIDSVWSVHILKRFLGMPDYFIHNRLVQLSGFIMPFIEIGGAIGLLCKSTIKIAAVLLIAMHIFLLLFLGPTGINYNVVVWPWNVQMMLLLYYFFVSDEILLRPVSYKSLANIFIAVCWVVLPVAGWFGYWDKFLSSGMYSGRGKLVQFYFNDRNRIPAELRPYAFYNKTDSSARIVLTDWSVYEMGVAAVTEPRVLKSIVQQLNDRYALQHIHFILTETRL